MLTDRLGCGLPEEAVTHLRQSPATRLALFCDGFDELRVEEDVGSTDARRRALADFAATLCGDEVASCDHDVVVLLE